MIPGRLLIVRAGKPKLAPPPDASMVHVLDGFRVRLVVDVVYRPIALVQGARKHSVAEFFEGAVAIGDLSKAV